MLRIALVASVVALTACGGADNVGACESYVAALECGDYDFGDSLDCSTYETYPCDISEYFTCLADGIECTDGVPDFTGQSECASKAQCN